MLKFDDLADTDWGRFMIALILCVSLSMAFYATVTILSGIFHGKPSPPAPHSCKTGIYKLVYPSENNDLDNPMVVCRNGYSYETS